MSERWLGCSSFAVRTDDCVFRQLRQSEIQNFNLRFRRYDHVAGFDVAMNNAGRVRRCQCACDLQPIFERRREGHACGWNQPVQRLPWHILEY